MKYCHYCGKSLPEDALFCPSCGKRLAVKPESPKYPERPERPEYPERQETPEISISDKPERKQSSLWGCTLVVLCISLLAAGIVYLYNMFAGQTNALAPSDEIVAADTILAEETDEDSDSAEDEVSAAEFALRRRVQNIYSDVLKMDDNANYVGRYCTSGLQRLMLRADDADPMWADFNFWVAAQDWEHPQLEQVQVKSFGENRATLKVAVHLFITQDDMSFITLDMLKEGGTWLIDDFTSNGVSLRTLAHRAIVTSDIISEFNADSVAY